MVRSSYLDEFTIDGARYIHYHHHGTDKEELEEAATELVAAVTDILADVANRREGVLSTREALDLVARNMSQKSSWAISTFGKALRRELMSC